MWKQKNLKLMSSEGRAQFNGEEGGIFQIKKRVHFLTRRASGKTVWAMELEKLRFKFCFLKYVFIKFRKRGRERER